ncbi:hypothetical protein KR074_005132 [Drosophila pseudoananassae]|nr:hypothetical protein KR074_005132 [Drosophila pseudoananassae]
MLSTRKEVDEQVHKLLGKMLPGKERDFKGLAVARLYNRINEYPKAIEYLNSYLRVKDEAVAHKLIAHCYKNLKTPDLQKALQHYQRCIQLSPRQPDVIKEACQLLLDEKGLFNVERAKYWLDLAAGEDLSENELVFALKMRVEHRETNGNVGAKIDDENNLELLMHKELQARPHDVNVRIRLLRSYVEKKNLEQAFNYAYKVELEEAKGSTTQSIQWYEVVWLLLTKLEPAMAKDVKKQCRFWYLGLHCLDRLMQLSLESGNCLADSSSQLFRFDQYLHKFSNVLDRSADASQRELQQTCVDHYGGQLLLHAVALIFKRELLGSKNKWMVTLRAALPILFLGYQLRPPKEGPENLWLKHCDADQKNLLRIWRQNGSFRCAQLGRTLWGCLEPDNQKENTNPQQSSHSGLFANAEDLLSCLRQQCLDKNWRRQLYQQLFTHAEHKLKEQTSHLVRHPRLQSPVAEWPDLAEIEGYELESLSLPPHSLNMHVYLALGTDPDNLGDAPRVVFYEAFQRDVKQSLTYCGYESLCQLDIDVFLYATVIQTQRRLQIQRETYESSNLGNRSANARPLMMPYSNIITQLSATEQSQWWDLVLRLHRNQLTNEGNRTEQRAQLQLGLEAVRGVNGPKADAIIIFRLGKILQSRADRFALETRIESLYRHGFGMLRRQQKQQLEPFTRVFKYGSAGSTSAWQELQSLAEHAVSYFSAKMFKAGQYEQFVDEVRGLNLPMASYLQAEAYRQLEDSGKTPRVSRARYSERRRECLQQTSDLLRNDGQHPLSSVIQRELRRCQQNRSFQAGGDDSFGTPELHNNSSTYEDAEDDFYTVAANRSRRHLNSTTTPATPQQVVVTTAPPSHELEETVKQISKSLCLLKDDVSVGLEGVLQEIKNLNERFNGMEDLLKKLKISSTETPTRDVDPAAALGLDDLFIIEDALAEQQQQQTAAHQVVQPPYGGPAPGYYNGVPNTPSAQERFLQGAYGSPMYNQNQMYNYYAAQAQAQAQAQFMRTPPAPGSGIPPANMFGPRNQNFGLPSMFPPPPAGQGAPYIDPMANFSQPPPSLLPPAPQPAPLSVPVPAPGPLNLVESKGAPGGGFFNASSPAFAQQTKPLIAPSVPAPAPAATASVAALPAAAAAAPPVSVAPQAAPVNAPPIFNRALNNQPVEKEPPANVVITSSDPLPKPTVTSVQPTLSVTIPAQHIKPSLVQAAADPPQVKLPAPTAPFTFSFGTNATESPFSFKSQVAKAAAEKQKEQEAADLDQSETSDNRSGAADNSTAEDYDPRPDFKAIIPLPDEVEVKTGEEDEEVKFSFRAKLFRHADREWKERGTGILKILYNSTTGVSRVLMRREQTHKICANHTITSDMDIGYIGQEKDRNKLIWAANDFADEKLTLETFLVRFKAPETANEFREAFTAAKQSAKTKSVEKPKEKSVAPAVASVKSSAIFSQPKSFVTSTPAGNIFNKPQDQTKPKQSEPNAAPDVAKSLFGAISSHSAAPPTSTPSSSATPSPFANFSFTTSATSSGAGTGATPFGNLSFGSVSAVNTSGNSTLFTTALVKDNTLQQQPQPTPQLNKSSASDAEDEYVPTAQFAPVIQLPDLVEVITGEENEEVLFEHRAKLLRFDKEANEWKERGLGNMKVLRDRQDHSQARLLMRREQIHKLCCNQRLFSDTKFSFALNLKAAVTWAGQDFSEEELTTELLCVRFKTPELCQQFLDAIKVVQDEMGSIKKEDQEPPKKVEEEKPVKGFGDAFKPKTGSWTCDACYTSNDKDQAKCVACQEPKDKTLPAKPSGGMDQSNALNLSTSTTGQFSFGFARGAANASLGGFTFGSTAVSTTSPSVETLGSGITLPTTVSTNSPSVVEWKSTGTTGFGDAFKPKAGSWSCSGCYVSNTAEALKCSACETPKDGSTETKKETLGSGISLPATTKFSFGFPPQPAGKDPSSAPDQPPKPAGSLFGSASFSFTPSQPATAAVAPLAAGPAQAVAPAAPIGSTNFNFSMPKPAQLQPKSPIAAVGNEADDNEYHEEEENNAYFAPVIPLPDKVDVKTGEEDEEVLYSHRAKLYRLWENSEWKERGLGEVKILRHKETKRLRVVMRREQVFKICLNHALNEHTPSYKRKDERSWMFAAYDFSEGESVLQKFTVRFKNAEIAQEFYAAVQKAKAVLAGAPEARDESPASACRDGESTQDRTEYKECPGCRGCDSDAFVFPKTVGELQQNITAEDDPSATLPMYQPALKLPPPGFAANTTSPLFKASSLGTSTTTPFTGFGNLSVSEENKPPSSGFLFGSVGKPAPGTPSFGLKSSSFSSAPQGNVLGSIFGGVASDNQSLASNASKSIFGGVQEKSDAPKSIFGTPQKNEGSKSIFGNVNSQNSADDSPKSIFEGVGQANPKSEAQKSIFGGLQQKAEDSKSTFGAGGAASVGGSGGFVFGSSNKAPGSIFDQKTSLFSNLAKPTDGDKPNEGEKSKEQKDTEKESEKTPVFSFGDAEDKKTPASVSFGDLAANTFSGSTFADRATKSGGTFADLAAKSGGTFADLAAKSGGTFADLAANSQGTEAVGFKKSGGGGFYNLTHQNAFKNFQSPQNESGKDAGDEDEDGDATNDDNYDPHYDPIVELPDEIVVTTGEENETKLFGERAKLYRFDSDTKQWKERGKCHRHTFYSNILCWISLPGCGEIKVLEHKELQKFRLLMRQEQIHKLVLNMKISDDLHMNYLNEQKKSFCWAGYNYAVDAEGKVATEGMLEQLAVRFTKQEIADEFLAKVKSCIERAKTLANDAEDASNSVKEV